MTEIFNVGSARRGRVGIGQSDVVVVRVYNIPFTLYLLDWYATGQGSRMSSLLRATGLSRVAHIAHSFPLSNISISGSLLSAPHHDWALPPAL